MKQNIDDLRSKTDQRRQEANQQRIRTIEVDVETGMTFLELAATELDMGNLERVARLVERATAAHTVTGKFLARITDQQEFQRLSLKRLQLEKAIRDLEHQMRLR